MGRAGMLRIYRELIKSFTGFMCFDGWMIAKAEFRIKNCIEKTSGKMASDMEYVKNELIKQNKNYSVIQARMVCGSMEYMVIMYLIKPVKTDFIKDGVRQAMGDLQMDVPGSVYMFTLEYSKSNIKEFTDCTGDINYIHQVERPVVPGFLMFEDALEKGFGVDNRYYSAGCYTIVFRKPVFADETIDIYKAGSFNRIFAIPSGGHGSILWELEKDNG